MESRQRFVAHFDILGMVDAIINHPDEAWKSLSTMSAFLKRKLDLTLTTPSGIITKEISNRSQSLMFSDTVLIYTLSNSEDDLYQIFIESLEFFKDCISKCIPLRGAICHGHFDINSNEMNLHGKGPNRCL